MAEAVVVSMVIVCDVAADCGTEAKAEVLCVFVCREDADFAAEGEVVSIFVIREGIAEEEV